MSTQDQSIRIEYTPIRSALLAGHEQNFDLIVRIKGPKAPIQHVRQGVNLALVLDRSGSMQGAPLTEAKKCISFVLDRLGVQDRVALVAYDDRVDIIHKSASIEYKKQMLAALDKIEARHSTDLFAGWQAGKEQLSIFKKDYELNRVILLSDGQLNAGLTDPKAIHRKCSDAYESGFSTSTYGIGKYFDEHVMTLMADAGKGNAYYGETSEDLMEPFTQELDLLSYLYAHQLKAKITVADGVTFTCMNEFPQDKEGCYIIPNLPFDVENWLGLRLTIPKDFNGDLSSLVTIELTGKVLGDEGEEVRQSASFTTPEFLNANAFAVVNPVSEVVKYFSELQISKWQKQAAAYAKNREWQKVEQLIKRMSELELDEWGQAQLQEMKVLLTQKDQELLSKELYYASYTSSRSFKQGLQDYNTGFANQDEREEAEQSRHSFLRRKLRKGQNSKLFKK